MFKCTRVPSEKQLCMVYLVPLWKIRVFVDFHKTDVTHYKNIQIKQNLHGLKETFHYLYSMKESGKYCVVNLKQICKFVDMMGTNFSGPV